MRVKPKLIIQTLKKNGGAVRRTARELGISPGTVINWRNRSAQISWGLIRGRTENFRVNLLRENLKRESTRPKTICPTALTAKERESIVKLRQERGYGADKLAHILKLDKSSRTVHRFLGRKGLLPKKRNYRRPRYQETTHMYLKNVDRPGKLQMDVKYVTPELSGLVHTTYLYAVIDIHTRWKAGVILTHVDQALAIEALKYILPRLPEELRNHVDFIQTDNGLEFQKQFREFIADKGKLKTELGIKDGLKHHYIHKSSPNENAVIERSFRTDEEEFFWRIEKPKDLDHLNALYQQYLDDYNTFRPHLGLSLMTPEEKLLSYKV